MTKAQNETLCSQHVLHIDGNLLLLAFFLVIVQIEKKNFKFSERNFRGKPEPLKYWHMSDLFSWQVVFVLFLLFIFFSIFFLKYLAIRKSYFNIIFQCYKSFPLTINNNPKALGKIHPNWKCSWYPKKKPDLRSQLEVKKATSILTTW